MPAGDRRVIHATLSDYDGIETLSFGEGIQRRVSVRPSENSDGNSRKTRSSRRRKAQTSSNNQQD